MAKVRIGCDWVEVGPTPSLVYRAGFRSAEEVKRVADRCSSKLPSMQLDDVKEWFRSHCPQA